MDRQQREKILKYFLAALIVGIGGFAAVFLVEGVLALALIWLGMLVLFSLTPGLAHALARANILRRAAPTLANPIPDLWLEFQKQADALAAGANAITAFHREVKAYGDKLDTFQTLWPERAAQFQATHDDMLKTLKLRIAKLRSAQDKLGQFKRVIAEAQDAWDMTQAAMKASQASKHFDGNDPIDALRKSVGLEGVPSSLKRFMAELEASLALDYRAMTTLAATSSAPRLDMQPAVAAEGAPAVPPAP